MKKVFTILAIVGVMTACNNGEHKEVKADTPVVKVDTAAKATVDTAKKAVVDTTKKK